MLSTQLKLLRTGRKISQAKLARTLGISQQAVAKWEKNKSEPPPSTLKMIAEYFDVTIDFLLGNESSAPIFSDDEAKLVEIYRQLGAEDKQAIRYVLDKFSQSEYKRQPVIDQSNNNGNMFNVHGSNNYILTKEQT